MPTQNLQAKEISFAELQSRIIAAKEKERLEAESGNFSAVAHEMTEKFMRIDLTSREHRLVWFFIREIVGYGLKQKIIKTEKIVRDTALHRQHVNTALHLLIEKGVITRTEIDGQRGEYLYEFNERCLERTHATKTVKESYFDNGKVIHISDYTSPKQLQPYHQSSDNHITEPVTPKTPKPTPRAASGVSKEILKEREINLKRGIGESFTLLGKGTGSQNPKPRQCSDPEAEKKRQLAMLREMEVSQIV